VRVPDLAFQNFTLFSTCLQIEVALFFLLCRHHSDLFFAGDPAQSVVEGSDFRFEDIRTVAHQLFQNEKRGKKVIPDKPLQLNVNFRSHSGILNVASGVLDMLFSAFPGSAKELPKDKGLFRGPRPGVFMNVEPVKLQELLFKIDGAFVLTHDAEVSRVKYCLGNYELILGIRDSKGLEFKDVVLVDFSKGCQQRIKSHGEISCKARMRQT
jgi:superfamily I DNA/RNA helicase